MSATFVKCPCQHCSKKIEFDAENFSPNQTISCPHCGLETIIFIPRGVANAVPPPPLPKNVAIKGTIIDFSIRNNEGLISGENRQRYKFKGSDWKSDKSPENGQTVDFIAENDDAHEIYLVSGSAAIKPNRQCSRVAAGLFAIFLGAFGIHRFYTGDVKWGLVYLLGGLFSFGFLWVVTAVAGLIEGIIYLSSTESEFQAKYVKN